MWELYVKDADGWRMFGKYQFRGTACGLSTRFMNEGRFTSTIVINEHVEENFFLKKVREEARLRN